MTSWMTSCSCTCPSSATTSWMISWATAWASASAMTTPWITSAAASLVATIVCASPLPAGSAVAVSSVATGGATSSAPLSSLSDGWRISSTLRLKSSPSMLRPRAENTRRHKRYMNYHKGEWRRVMLPVSYVRFTFRAQTKSTEH